MTDAIGIAVERPDTAEARALLEASDALMNALYPPEDNYLLDVAALLAPDITFLVCRRNGRAVGCGAIARRDGYVEIKRVFVAPEARGLGLSKRLMAELERVATAEGFPLARLETGDRQLEALGLYHALGYVERGAFGDYPEGPPSVFMEKRL